MITFSSLGYLGRLGNQMFQYALLLSVRERTGHEVVLRTDNLAGLGCFRLSGCEVEEHVPETDRYNERGASFHFDERVFSVGPGTDFCGYFQSHRYLEPGEREIRQAFRFRTGILAQAGELLCGVRARASGREVVAVHVRRGDYLNHATYHQQFEMGFYERARERFRGLDPLYLIYSDDKSWCAERFLRDDELVMDIPDGSVAMCLASLCDHFICSGSTFSWWAAWLATNRSKRVVVPTPWFGPDYPWSESENELSPMDWIRVAA